MLRISSVFASALRGLALVSSLALGNAAIVSGAAAAELKIALIYGKTGPLEFYAKQTETGLRLGLEYATGGKMELNGRKITIITKDDQGKPDLAKSLLAEAYEDDGADIAIGTTSSAATLAMLPVISSATAGSTTRIFLCSSATGSAASVAADEVVPIAISAPSSS